MLVSAVWVILVFFAIYIAVGILFTIAFQIKGLQKIDEGVHGASIGFRIIVVPGCIIFWPVLLKRWVYEAR